MARRHGGRLLTPFEEEVLARLERIERLLLEQAEGEGERLKWPPPGYLEEMPTHAVLEGLRAREDANKA
jgi:hypothetical protein